MALPLLPGTGILLSPHSQVTVDSRLGLSLKQAFSAYQTTLPETKLAPKGRCLAPGLPLGPTYI
jgi:hypothetical protein